MTHLLQVSGCARLKTFHFLLKLFHHYTEENDKGAPKGREGKAGAPTVRPCEKGLSRRSPTLPLPTIPLSILLRRVGAGMRKEPKKLRPHGTNFMTAESLALWRRNQVIGTKLEILICINQVKSLFFTLPIKEKTPRPP